MSEPDVSSLLTVPQAIQILDRAPVSPQIIRLPLAQAQGLYLAEDLSADRDYPPFDKSLMDGYAVRTADVATIPVALKLAGEIAAGSQSDTPLAPGQAVAIMTGAPIPPGADGVIPIEDTTRQGDLVQINHADRPQRFIARRAADIQQGAIILGRGTLLQAAQIAAAATIGAAQVAVYRRPRAAILSTGDEIVPVDVTPTGPQIRNSNSLMLAALLTKLGCETTDLGIARDDPQTIRTAIERGLAHDVLFITGGMSMGAYDYVPQILRELNFDLQITKLRIKPGKPFVFAIREGSEERVQGALLESSSRHPEEVLPTKDLAQKIECQIPQAAAASLGMTVRDRISAEQVQGSDKDESAIRNPQSAITPPSAFSIQHLEFKTNYIFGLPGNPVSGFACTIRLASRLLTRLAGGQPQERWIHARLSQPLGPNGPREFYQPARMEPSTTGPTVTPLPWKGSADLFTLASANVLLVRPENDPARPAGDQVQVMEI